MLAAKFEKSPGWTYVKIQPAEPATEFVVHGEIGLRYTFPQEATPPPPPPLKAAAARAIPRKAHAEEGGGMEEVRKRLGRKAFERVTATMQSAPPPPPPNRMRTGPPHTRVRLPVEVNITAHQPSQGPASTGSLTRDRTSTSAVKEMENSNAADALKVSTGK
jgi:hypothetical protein